MVKVPHNILILIKQYVSELEKIDVHVEQAILYGSYAKGEQNEWSDIDVAVVSRDFSGNRIADKSKMIKAKFATSHDISPLPYRPEDFTPDDLFVREILKYGIRIV